MENRYRYLFSKIGPILDQIAQKGFWKFKKYATSKYISQLQLYQAGNTVFYEYKGKA